MRVQALAKLVVVGSVLTATVAALRPETINISGSVTVRPVVDKAVKLFAKSRPDVQIAVGGGGSGRGMAAVVKGEVQIGMVSRDLKADEKTAYPDLVALKIGVDGIAVFVNKKNAVRGISKAALAGVFTGAVKNWKELGGADAPIVPISSNEHHGTFDAFKEFLGLENQMNGQGAGRTVSYRVNGGAEWGAPIRMVDGTAAQIAAVSTQPNGIAFGSLGTTAAIVEKGGAVAMLELDGVAPSVATTLSGAYGFQRPLILVTKGAPAGAAAVFLDFMKGPDGQKIVQELGFIPAAN